MQEINPKKKSKALIITFVLVLAILIVGYFIFQKNSANTNTKGEIKGNIFTSLFGSSKQKKVDSLDDGVNTNIDKKVIDENGNLLDEDGNLIFDENGDPINTENNNREITTGGGRSFPPFNPFPNPNSRETCYDGIRNQDETRVDFGGVCSQPGHESCYDGIRNQDETGVDTGGVCATPADKTECSDGLDNDRDGLIDFFDSSCHSDFTANNSSSYDPSIEDEGREAKTKTYQCPDDPLVFTSEEQKELDKLTREFYKISATLRTPDDINAEYATRRTYSDLVQKAEELTLACVEETNKVTYKGPTERRTNPYMNKWEDFKNKYLSKLSSSKIKIFENSTTYLPGVNLGEKEPPAQSLYEIVNLVQKSKETKLSTIERKKLNLLITNALGPSYEEGETLPTSQLDQIKDLFISPSTNGAIQIKNKDGDDGYKRAIKDAGLTLKEVAQMKNNDVYRFVYAPPVNSELTTHYNSCEGYFSYSANGFNFSPSIPIYSINGGNDYYRGNYGYTNNPKVLENLKTVLGDQSLTLESFGISSDTTKIVDKYFNSVYSYIWLIDNYIQKEDDVGGEQIFDTANMTRQNQHACNDIYGLKLLLSKTDDISTINNYLSKTICYINNVVGDTSCAQDAIDAAINAGYNDIGYDWVKDLNNKFAEFEEQFRIW